MSGPNIRRSRLDLKMKEMDADTKSTTFGAPMLLQLKLKLRKSDRQAARLLGREGLLAP
ncbi:hypothetical protein [Moorena producens]|uniref:hypothetical protein n=1 Tax=Moorena producens TaxID=1155739 RepID=UPI003C7601D3